MFPVLKISQVKNSFSSFTISSSDLPVKCKQHQTKVLTGVNGNICKKRNPNYCYWRKIAI
jgi:hypothetical protein